MSDELTHNDAMTRVIHLLDAAGRVVQIGWEPACSIVDRRKALSQTVEVINRVSEFLTLIHTRRIPPSETAAAAATAILTSDQAESLVNAMADLRALMPAAARGVNKGMGFPWPPDQQQRKQRAA